MAPDLRRPVMGIVFGGTIFISSFLLFVVELILAKALLPWFGGTPAVWTTCLLFFQGMLLAGYAYAHGISRHLALRRQGTVHLLLLAASIVVGLVLLARWGSPILPGIDWKPDGTESPVGRIFLLLCLGTGLPYFILSATGPLLQAWFALLSPGVSPYRLYALSNAGSLLGLVSYPFLIEPWLGSHGQAAVWAVGFLVFAVASGTLAARLRTAPQAADPPSNEAKPAMARRVLWTLLAAVPSVLLLSTTNQICQEVAVIPFLWMVPLVLYLLSFIICFDRERWYVRPLWMALWLTAFALVYPCLLEGARLPAIHQLEVLSALLFASCMICHGELVRLKPDARQLTSFYLCMASGGALGGLFVSLIAPLVFPAYWELHVGLTACAVMGLVVVWRDRSPRWAVAAGLVVVATVSVSMWTVGRQYLVTNTLVAVRGFYGVLRVVQTDTYRMLLHGATNHGFQLTAAGHSMEPTGYYGPFSGVGRTLAVMDRLRPQGYHLGVVGMGVGTLAAYGRPQDNVRFYEINPQVIDMSTGPHPYFTFVSGCQAPVDIVPGDGRIALERELAAGRRSDFDVLVLDAFSSDSIPLHLLTQEAFRLYFARLRPGGVLALHVSNRYLNLQPVIGHYAHTAGLSAAYIQTEGDAMHVVSEWMLLARDESLFHDPLLGPVANRVHDAPVRLWTDDYTNVLEAFRW